MLRPQRGFDLDPKWLQWTKTLQSIAQNGLTFAQDPYDRERYTQLQRVAVEIMSAYSGADFAQVLDLFQREHGYATPKVDVRAAVFRNDEILMVLEREDGRWSLPGGWADVGETPAEVAEREVLEESGFITRAVGLLAIYDRDRQGHPPLPFHVYKIFLQCDLLDKNSRPNADRGDAAFFPEGKLPELSLTRVTRAEITRLFEHLHDPSLPADFD
jgi:ADP-ribose pyrophosphatase YjhB (NUDIX family)